MAKKASTKSDLPSTPFRIPVGTDIPGDIDMLIIWDVFHGQGQGDPDCENSQRIDSNDHGEVTSPGLKRELRDLYEADGHQIHIRRGSLLESNLLEAQDELKEAQMGTDSASISAKMVSKFIDVKLFGGVFASGKIDSGRCKGPVQVSDAVTILPVSIRSKAITMCASSTEKDEEKGKTMGRHHSIDYGIFVQRVHISKRDAARNGVMLADVDQLIHHIKAVFNGIKSHVRGQWALRGLVVVRHSGNRVTDFTRTVGFGYGDLGIVNYRILNDEPASFADFDFHSVDNVEGATVDLVLDPVKESKRCHQKKSDTRATLSTNEFLPS